MANAPLSTAPARAPRAGIVGWVMFDWAMQPFFTLVTTFVFAPWFAAHLARDPATGQAQWGYATAFAGLVIAVLSPVLGSVADALGRHKPWVAAFGVLMMLGSSALWFATPHHPAAVALALAGFVIGTIGAEFATVFNNAMMPRLVPREELGRLSGTGWAIGYVGGLVSLVLVLGFLAADTATGRTLLGLPPLFGLDPATGAGPRAAGPFSALWFVVFALPMFLFTPDAGRGGRAAETIGAGLARLADTARDLRAVPGLGRFLIANMIYTDGLVALFAFGGIYAAGVFGWSTIELGIFGILLTITGSIGAWAGGRLDDRFGSRAVVLGALTLLFAMLLTVVSIDRTHVFFAVEVAGPAGGLFAGPAAKVYLLAGAIIGLGAGPLQAASRTQLARMAPPEAIARFYGFFALSGKVTSFMGPLAVAMVTDWTDSQRAGAGVLAVFLVTGFVLMAGVKPIRRF
ncbi:MAG: MFS transporter [Siculibacillus sp.]|nr:MFS transporter [Siculibacillus sp.]